MKRFKRFPLTRRFALTSLACLAVAALTMAWVFTRHNEGILRTAAETQNAVTTQLLGNLIWPRHREFLSRTDTLTTDALRQHPVIAEIQADITRFARGTTLLKVKIYDLGGRVVFSSSREQIGALQPNNQGFAAARTGRIASELTHRDTFDAFESRLEDRDLISSYVPMRDANGGIEAVFEIYSDVTALIHQMQETRRMVVFNVAFPTLAIYLLLFFSIRNADLLIARQHKELADANRNLEMRVNERTAELQHMAHHDPLTSLPNRTLLTDRLQHALHRCERLDLQCTLLFLDLDNFKHINDTLGHAVGDTLLVTVSQKIRGTLRSADTVARLGGDEFVVLLDPQEGSPPAAAVAQKILETLDGAYLIEAHEVFVSASIGIALYPGDGTDPDTLLRNADAAMYQAKSHGRNNFHFYAPEMTEHARERLTLEVLLRHAADRNELFLLYQPQFDIPSRRLVGVEALVRWANPNQGIISPVRFIPLAEESGAIISIGAWVLREACSAMARWRSQGVAPDKIAINISVRQLERPEFTALVRDTLADTGLPPECVELEITESVIMNATDVIDRLLEVRDIGVKLSIDDFGTGYSSLSYLHRLPIDKLKIDRSFLMDLATGEDNGTVVRAIINLARSLNLSTVAEGVEQEFQMDFLRNEGCDVVQGFLTGKPMGEESLMELVRQG